MLLNALLYVALIAVIATTFLSAGLAVTRATIHRAAQPYIAAGEQRALSALVQTLAGTLQQGALPSPLPSLTPIPPACVDASNPCKYTTSETIALTQTTSPVAVASCNPEESNCAANEQANAYVDEGRITARISVQVAAADGTVLATRAHDVVLRTLNTPPYLALAGARDGAFDDVEAPNSYGDDGGLATALPDACSTPPPPGTSDDTLVRVAYRNQTTSACMDGSSWRTSSFSSNSGAASGWLP